LQRWDDTVHVQDAVVELKRKSCPPGLAAAIPTSRAEIDPENDGGELLEVDLGFRLFAELSLAVVSKAPTGPFLPEGLPVRVGFLEAETAFVEGRALSFAAVTLALARIQRESS